MGRDNAIFKLGLLHMALTVIVILVITSVGMMLVRRLDQIIKLLSG